MDVKLMPIEIVKIDKIKINPANPRIIKNYKYKKLLKSIIEFPEMLFLRPIVVNSEMIVIGGNQRYRACQEAGLKDVPIIMATEFNKMQISRFMITDNVSFGDWDFDILANNWDSELIDAAGLDLWQQPDETDYGKPDDIQLDNSDTSEGTKKTIKIEFEPEHYDETKELIDYWVKKQLYIGGFIMEKLKEEKYKDI